jgi:diguanylate cyclase
MGELRRGMAAGDVKLAYQPKMSLATGEISHVEALVRWDHPDDGPIAPDRFIPLAESTGVVSELTAFVLERAVSDCARWKAFGIEVCVSVNVSAADLADAGFADRVKRILARHEIDPGNLALEVTESAIIRSASNAIAVLEGLRQFGVRLSIDDYGTGQSTLSYLKDLPVHELKIDKSFVSSMSSDDGDRIMVRSTIDLAHELGLQVVAEGVEDAQTLALLRSFGCDFVQGYYLGKAVSFDDLSKRLSHESNWCQSA